MLSIHVSDEAATVEMLDRRIPESASQIDGELARCAASCRTCDFNHKLLQVRAVSDRHTCSTDALRKLVDRERMVCYRDDFVSNNCCLGSQCGAVDGGTTLTDATTSELPKIGYRNNMNENVEKSHLA